MAKQVCRSREEAPSGGCKGIIIREKKRRIHPSSQVSLELYKNIPAIVSSQKSVASLYHLLYRGRPVNYGRPSEMTEEEKVYSAPFISNSVSSAPLSLLLSYS